MPANCETAYDGHIWAIRAGSGCVVTSKTSAPQAGLNLLFAAPAIKIRAEPER